MRLAIVVLATGCSEYGVGSKPETPPGPLDTGTPPAATTPPVVTTPPSCDGEVLPTLSWVGSASFSDPADPVDGGGLPFWDPAADLADWAPVAIPDTTIPVGLDRAYVARFALTDVPYDLSLDLESDDGITVWVNGEEIGAWGGSWQMEGCVNEHANCVVTTDVPAVDVTDRLVVGDNVVAARVSNPVLNSWFEVVPLCVD